MSKERFYSKIYTRTGDKGEVMILKLCTRTHTKNITHVNIYIYTDTINTHPIASTRSFLNFFAFVLFSISENTADIYISVQF